MSPSGRQLRLKTYEVRAETLILVFKPKIPIVPKDDNHNQIPSPQPMVPQKERETLKSDRNREKEVPLRTPAPRLSKRKANLAINEQALAKIISIQNRFNRLRSKRKKKSARWEVWDYLVVHDDPPPTQLQQGQHHPPADDDGDDHYDGLEDLFCYDPNQPPKEDLAVSDDDTWLNSSGSNRGSNDDSLSDVDAMDLTIIV